VKAPLHTGSAISDNLSQLGPADVFGTLFPELGPDATFRLIEEFGGTRLFVAKVPREGSRVVNAIGMEAACRLAAKFGSDTIALPLARSWRVQVYRARGWSHPRIAKAVGVSEATVARLLKDMGLTNLPPPRAAEACPGEGAATPPPLATVRMPVIRRGTGPDLPLFACPAKAFPAVEDGSDRSAPHV
jgi:hypothetical protein